MLIVRCPACNTVFRVRPEQLRTHGGRVRCGSCYRPFNAVENLMDQGDSALPTNEFGTAAPVPAADAPGQDDLLEFGIPDDFLSWARTPDSSPSETAPEPSVAGLQYSHSDARRDTAPPADMEHPAQRGAQRDEGLARAVADSAARQAPERVYSNPFAEPATDLDAPTEPLADYVQPEATAESVPGGDPSEEDTDFPQASEAPAEHIADSIVASAALQHAPSDALPVHAARDEAPVGILQPTGKEHADWRREESGFYPDWLAEDNGSTAASSRQPGTRRWLWGLALGILAGTLTVQAAYLFRQEIARNWPDTRPYYLELCAQLGCTVPLPRIASAINIESSNLESDPATPTRFVLIARVRNLAPHPLQHPHLELTLTDTRDRPVVRRVITPDEWVPGGAGSSAAPESTEFPARSDIEVSVPFRTAGTIGAVGYRLYAFYP